MNTSYLASYQVAMAIGITGHIRIIIIAIVIHDVYSNLLAS